MTIAQNIINWARGRVGKTIGGGECWDLVNSAAIAGGAQGSEYFGTIGNDVDYIWGEEVELSSVQAGDLIQTRDHLTTWTIDVTITYPDGSTGGDIDHKYLPRPHHSAIVTGLLDRDGALATLEQNIDPKGKVVQVQKLHTRDVPAVTTVKKLVSVPDPNDDKKKVRATVATETTITVEGTITVFRPEKR